MILQVNLQEQLSLNSWSCYFALSFGIILRICFGKKAAEKEAGKNKEKQKKALKKNEKPCQGIKPEARFFC